MKLASAILVVSAGLLVVTGCETGRVQKAHADWQSISDNTTTGKPDTAKAASATGQPPVPGSPTAAGADGLQPLSDSEARASVGSEEGKPPLTNHHTKGPSGE